LQKIRCSNGMYWYGIEENNIKTMHNPVCPETFVPKTNAPQIKIPLKNANQQLRKDIEITTSMNCTPWNNSTIEPDIYRKEL